MAKIVSTLSLRNRFEILKVEFQSSDLFSDEDYNMVKRYVASNPLFTHFRYLTGMLRCSDGHYFTYYLCSKSPRKRVSQADLDMIKSIIDFSQL